MARYVCNMYGVHTNICLFSLAAHDFFFNDDIQIEKDNY